MSTGRAMEIFFEAFDGMPRLGPGQKAATHRAYRSLRLPSEPRGPARSPRGPGNGGIAGHRAKHPPRQGGPSAALVRLDVTSAGTSPVKHDSQPAPTRPASTGDSVRTPSILDLGCGSGGQTLDLAEISSGRITAVDNHAPFLEQLRQEANARGVGERVRPVCMDMAALDFPGETFDLIWCEAAIYNVGFAKGLSDWKSLLTPGGRVAVSEACWLRPDPPGDRDLVASGVPGDHRCGDQSRSHSRGWIRTTRAFRSASGSLDRRVLRAATGPDRAAACQVWG